MVFKQDKAIYLQIAEHIMENILAEKWQENERIPSVRDLAVSIEVNPNTVVHSYAYLQEKGIIFNQRGIGYFVSGDGVSRVQQLQKETFFEEQLPQLFKSMTLLNIDLEELVQRFQQYNKGQHENE